MGSETNAPSSSASAPASPIGKRNRDPEDEVYLDNLHSSKRYLSEIMASSLNGLTVGDSLPDNLMESPGRDEMSLQYSPMSEDSDDSRYYETPVNTCLPQPDSIPSSPVSPCRFQRQLTGFTSGGTTTSYPPYGGNVPPVTSSQSRQRGSDSEGRFPSSPSDICHSADLRRAALLRSVQMRAQPSGPPAPFELPSSPGQEPGHSMEAEQQPVTYMKSTIVHREYQIDECSALSIAAKAAEKSCRALDMDLKGKDDDPAG